ncbi:pilus assembly protein [Microbulbifer pacificus]|uniref:pilus assembly protein n=1 Tax=Microbulbifer pacificus TaxID=407164 RepID=UPI000CF4F9A3|nr:PilC/PilY family type IV pilus protein [Microbulbifer pacificus]
MKWNNKIKQRLSLRSLSAAFLLSLATSVSAAPGDLSDVPLYTRGSAEPNIMFVLDSSGSMQGEIWPPSEYDENATYASCANPISSTYRYWSNGKWRTGNYEVQFQVDIDDGSVKFKMDSGGKTEENWREWDSTNDCFDDDADYRAWIHAYNTSNDYYYTGSDPQFGDYRDESASGHLLNWFFSSRNEAGTYEAAKFLEFDGDAARSKVAVTRTDVMKTSAIELVSDLEDVRIGLMQFDGSDGARALRGLESVTDDNRTDYLNVIKGITADGSTPLAESFTGVGRYFITGFENKDLSYKGSDGGTVTTAGKNIFNFSPDWDDVTPNVAKPTSSTEGAAIQFYCQKSFMVALTDGEPTSDDSISDHLKGYDYNCSGNPGGCTSSEMDDVIKALYDIDLRPDLKEPDGTPVKHNIISYIIGFANDGLTETDVMKNAGKLGGGGVYTADNAAELKVTFNQIISKVHAIVGSSSSVAFNSTSLEADSAIYAAKFDSGDWSGELSALAIDSAGNISTTASWEAGTILDQTAPSTRTLLTYKPGTGGVAFTAAGLDFTGSDGDTELDLNINTSTGVSVADNRASERVDYLRGDRTKEGNGSNEFRQRSSRLGDIVNSTPVYVGEPVGKWENAEFAEASSYAAFKSGKASRTPMVYVGANDGFLHGFNASTTGTDAGKELIGYLPSVLSSTETELGLHALTSQNYLHKYYVDGTPTVGDAYINSAWKTVLVGGLGGGGKGYFALDITNPASFTAANAGSLVLWEFTDSSNSNLGYSYSRPQIGRMSNGKWAAVFGNGYNSLTGDAGLFIVYLDGSGHVYLSTSTGSQADKNGLSTPAIIDTDLDGTIDRVYAGDLRGNMWAFDVETNAKWTSGVATGTVNKLFTAAGEPITGAPLVARNTANENGASPNLLVTFGSGQYLTDADTANTAAGGFYAVSDNGTYNLDKNNLEPRSIGTKDVTQSSGGTVQHRTLSGTALNWSNKSGWYISLLSGVSPDGGERVTTRPDLLRNVLFFNTLIPTGQVCSAGGYGWLMSVDVRTGLAPSEYAVYDANNDGVIDSADMGVVGEMVNEGIPNKPGFLGGKRQYTSTSAGTINDRDINVGGGDREGRLAWEEMIPN